jgi:hypothetical protein
MSQNQQSSETPLRQQSMISVTSGNREIAELATREVESTLERGAAHHVVDGVLSTARRDAVAFLLRYGATANVQNRDLDTPLHIAAALGLADVAVMLMEWGANRHAKDQRGRTPRDVEKPGTAIDWDYLSAEARQVLDVPSSELKPLLLFEEAPTRVLRELCGAGQVCQLFAVPRWDEDTRPGLDLALAVTPALRDHGFEWVSEQLKWWLPALYRHIPAGDRTTALYRHLSERSRPDPRKVQG